MAKFSSYKHQEIVRQSCKEAKGTKFYINEQFPPFVIAQCKYLFPVMKQKRVEGRRVRLVYNKLYIDGKLHQPAAPMGNQGKM